MKREEEPRLGVGMLQRFSGTSIQEEGNLGWHYPGSQESQKSRPQGLRALRLWEDINFETVTGESRRGKKSRLHEQISMHFCFHFSAADVPTSWCLSLEMGQAKLGAGAQLLFCGVAGRGASSAHRPLSSPLERIGSCCKWSLVSQSLHPPVIGGEGSV